MAVLREYSPPQEGLAICRCGARNDARSGEREVLKKFAITGPVIALALAAAIQPLQV